MNESYRDGFGSIPNRFRTVLESTSRDNSIETFVSMVSSTTLNPSNADLRVGVCCYGPMASGRIDIEGEVTGDGGG